MKGLSGINIRTFGRRSEIPGDELANNSSNKTAKPDDKPRRRKGLKKNLLKSLKILCG